MKKSFFLLLAWFTLNVTRAQTTTSSVPPPTAWSATIIDGNSTSWQRTEYKQDPNGNIITNTSSYTELASGLNHLVGNQFVPSSDEIEVLPDGTAEGTNCQHQVYFSGDIYNGEIRMVTPEGEVLQSQPLALRYDDGSNTVLLAVLTNSTGELISQNQVLYPNAFFGVNADLLYTYTREGFSQDIIIRAQPPTPESFNMNSQNTKLQLLTEFISPPQAAVTEQQLPAQAGMALNDDSLDFGIMKMVSGKTFLLGSDAHDAGVLVGKDLENISGRQILIEEVPVMALKDELTQLPVLQNNNSSKANSLLYMVSAKRLLPSRHVAQSEEKAKIITKTFPLKNGLVMDYNIINGSITNYTFQGDTTYYISGAVNLYGTNTFEGGTVLKYTNGASITLEDLHTIANWSSSAYLPVICTAKDDNNVGQEISGSTGTPSGYYANPALALNGNAPNISYFRIAYAQQGISAVGTTNSFENGQIVNCQNGIHAEVATTVNLENLLFDNVQTGLDNLTYDDNIFVQNSTFDLNSNLTSTTGSYQTVLPYFTNCIFVNIRQLTNNPNEYGLTYGVAGGNNGFYDAPEFGVSAVSNTFYPFQTVGGGSYYLTNGCAFIDAGTTNIDGSLLADLAAKTVYPPIVYSNVSISVPTTLSPQAQRDNTGDPALGYHYDALDYVFGGCSLSANLQVTAGTAIGFYGISGQAAGILLNNGADVTATGTATAPCWITFANSVQEGCNEWVNSLRNPAFQFNGSGSGEPQINTTFAKLFDGGWQNALVTDGHTRGACNFQSSEFWMGGFATYDEQFLNFSNCFFFRPQLYFWDQSDNPNLTFENCTIYDGILCIARQTYYSSSLVNVENTAFDGTAFPWSDNLNGTSGDTIEDYNAYNTSNLSWQSYSFPYGACYGTLQTVGSHTIYVTNYDWESSWFGNYYLPTNSPLIQAGGTNANFLGLFHFTTQTNQVPETNSIVDIGYHYVATDQNGNPLETDGEMPDYLADANGNGLDDPSETPWNVPLTNLVLWLRADKGATTNSSDHVGTWADQSGRGNNATQTTGGNQPVWVAGALNGYPVVSFTAVSNQYFALPNFMNTNTAGGEAFVVVKAANQNPSTSHALWSIGSGGNGDCGYPTGNPGGEIWDDFGCQLQEVGVPAQPLTQYHIYQVLSTPNTWSAWINGTLQDQTSDNSFGWTGGSSLGAGYANSSYFDGDIAEVMVFNQGLTGSERTAVNGLLNLKYGLVPAVPAAPTNLAAIAISTGQISLTWNETANGGATQISIERSASIGGGFAVVAQIANSMSYVDTNLEAGTTYYYRIRAINFATWSPYSNETNATTLTMGTDMPFTNLVLWLKADSGLTQIGTNTSVLFWADQSGRGNNATQTTGGNQPVWVAGALNGYPVVSFTAVSNQYFALPNFMNTNTAGGEAFVVVKAANQNPSTSHALWSIGSGGNGDCGYPTGNPGGEIWDDFGCQLQEVGVPAQPLTQYHIYQVLSTPNTWSAWINGTLQDQTSDNSFGWTGGSSLGAGYANSSYFDGDIAEVMVFNQGLAPAQRDTIGTYLFSKYGLLQYATNAIPPSNPTNLLATGLAPLQLALQWSGTSKNVYSFNLERELVTSGTYQELATLPSWISNYVDTSASPTNTYLYRVKAHNIFGDSAYSAVISPPTISITNWPALTNENTTSLITAQAADVIDAVSNVMFFAQFGVNNPLFGTATAAPYAVNWIPTMTGSYSLTALATDNEGNSQYSTPVPVTVYLSSNTNGIPDYQLVEQGNDPINPWLPPPVNTNDHTAPIITLLIPTNAVLVP